MFPTSTYVSRRERLAAAVNEGLLLLPANGEAPMNYTHNTYPFRQDSNFRYFAGHNLPDLVLTLRARTGESRLYGNDPTLDDVIWTGERPTVAELARRIGAEPGGSLEQLATDLGRADRVHYLPPYREARRRQLREWLGDAAPGPSEEMIRGVVALRSVKDEGEIAEMDRAVTTSLRMHAAARAAAEPGVSEAEIAGLVEGIAIRAGGRLSYPAIVSRDGQILHNHYHGNTLAAGDLLLIDAGAEAPSGYAGDLTRTLPIGGPLTARQQPVYATVERALREATAAIRPGVRYREVHDLSARVITEGLSDLGLMRGDSEAAVAAGAHALFFPHGLGHLIGLDVHDMEDLGEDLVGYDAETQRSEQFGTRSLRLGRQLERGFTLTVEPGIYFIPALIDRWAAERRHAAFIDYAAVAAYRDFGGIRLEDNVVVTATGSRKLGNPQT